MPVLSVEIPVIETERLVLRAHRAEDAPHSHALWADETVDDRDRIDRMRELADEGVRHVVVVPIGFVSDHMEVVHDLDVEAAATAAELGLAMTQRCYERGLHMNVVQLPGMGSMTRVPAARLLTATCPPDSAITLMGVRRARPSLTVNTAFPAPLACTALPGTSTPWPRVVR